MGKKLGASFITKSSDGPGPGNYEPNFRATCSNLPMYTLKGRYPGKSPMQAPDPGAYNKTWVDKPSSRGFGFGTGAQRATMANTNKSPGPGNYKLPTTIAKKADYIENTQDEKFRVI